MADWWLDDQALAYAIVEQGRLACERLLADEHDARTARRLWGAHRGFGLSAYAASDHLQGGVRTALHVMVAEAGPAPVADDCDGPELPLLFAIHGATAIERCFTSPWLVDQMQVAHRAVRQAHVALAGIVGLGHAAQLTIDAARAGRLERGWQCAHLRPPKLTVSAAAPVPVSA